MTNSNNTAAPTVARAELCANLVCVLTGEFGGTLAQAIECNPSFEGLFPALPELVAALPQGQYLLVDLEAGVQPEHMPLFSVEDGTAYPPVVLMEWAQSCVLSEGPTVVYGSMAGDYSMVNTVSTPHGPGLSLGLAGSPLNSALSMWVLPAACWPTPEQMAPIKAAYLAATAEANAVVNNWLAEQAAKGE